MSNFEERKLVTNPSCASCKHCMISEIENDDGYAYTEMWIKVYHCMLGVSAEDRKFVENEIDSYEGYASEVRFTDKFNQIMRMKSEDEEFHFQYLDESVRSVKNNQCCQFYENRRKKNGQI